MRKVPLLACLAVGFGAAVSLALGSNAFADPAGGPPAAAAPGMPRIGTLSPDEARRAARAHKRASLAGHEGGKPRTTPGQERAAGVDRNPQDRAPDRRAASAPSSQLASHKTKAPPTASPHVAHWHGGTQAKRIANRGPEAAPHRVRLGALPPRDHRYLGHRDAGLGHVRRGPVVGDVIPGDVPLRSLPRPDYPPYPGGYVPYPTYSGGPAGWEEPRDDPTPPDYRY
jgi:hypothetical protein